MPKKPVQLGEFDFASKGDAYNFLKQMLNRYRPG